MELKYNEEVRAEGGEGTAVPRTMGVFRPPAQAPLSMDITLDLVRNGLRLHYAPRTQRLRVVEVYNARSMNYSYDNDVFRYWQPFLRASAEHVLTSTVRRMSLLRLT